MTNKTIKKTKNKHKTRKKRTFTKKQYSNPDGFLTSTWGPPLWHYLHTMSFNYPVDPSTQEKKNYLKFMQSLVHVLPCKYCRDNLKKNYKQLPLTMHVMKSRDSFSKYVFNLHELVNKMLNKKSNLCYSDVRDRYEHFRSRCNDKDRYENQKQKEDGCTESMYGKKSRCVMKIIPSSSKEKTMQIDSKCIGNIK